MSGEVKPDLLPLIGGISRARLSGSRVVMVLPRDGQTYEATVPDAVLAGFAAVLDVVDAGCVPVVVPGKRDLTTTQAADVLSVSRAVLGRLMDSGELPFHRVGRHRRIRLIDVLEFRRRVEERGRADAAFVLLDRADAVTHGLTRR